MISYAYLNRKKGTEEGFFPHHDAHDNNILQFWEVERGTEEGFFPHHDAHDNNILQFWEVERIAGIRLADIALTY